MWNPLRNYFKRRQEERERQSSEWEWDQGEEGGSVPDSDKGRIEFLKAFEKEIRFYLLVGPDFGIQEATTIWEDFSKRYSAQELLTIESGGASSGREQCAKYESEYNLDFERQLEELEEDLRNLHRPSEEKEEISANDAWADLCEQRAEEMQEIAFEWSCPQTAEERLAERIKDAHEDEVNESEEEEEGMTI